MDQPAPTIAVIQGASDAEIQDIFRALTERWQGQLRMAGVVGESHCLTDRFCPAGYLRNLATGTRFSIFHDLGPGTANCHLDGVGALAAAAAVQHDIAEGCDLVVLNKFGQLEAAGYGLADAFRATLATRLPRPRSRRLMTGRGKGSLIGNMLSFPPMWPRLTYGGGRFNRVR